MEDDFDSPFNGGDKLSASLPPVPPVGVEQDEKELEGEFFFAIQSFLTGLQELRDTVQEIWFEYKDGKVDSMRAALVANTAINLVRHAEAELDLLLPRPKKYPAHDFPVWTLPALLFSNQHEWVLDNESIRNFLFPSGSMPTRNHKCTQVRWVFWPVYSALKYHLYKVKSTRKPGTDIPEVNPFTFESTGGVHSDSLRTLDLAMKFRRFLVLHKVEDEHEDEVTRGMEHMFRENKVPIRTTFGIQILLDIQDILTQNHIEDPFLSLKENVEARILSYESTDGVLKPPLRRDQHMIEIQEFAMHNLKCFKTEVEIDYYNVLKHNPIRCGLLLHEVYLRLRNYALDAEAYTREISWMAHIYVATRLLDPDAPRWPDMEYLIHQQDPQRLFSGGLPKTLDECNRKLQLTMGKPLSEAANNARKAKQAKDKNNEGRWVQDNSILACIFSERKIGFKKTDEEVDALVTRLNNTIRSSKEQARLARKTCKPPGVVEWQMKDRRWRPFIEITAGNDNGSTALLRDLIYWLEGDDFDIYLEWQFIRNACWMIWETLGELSKSLPDWDAKWSETPAMAAYILHYAVKDEQKKGKIDRDDPNFALALRTALRVIQMVITRSALETEEMTATLGDSCVLSIIAKVRDYAERAGPRNPLTNGEGSFEYMYANWPEELYNKTGAKAAQDKRSEEITRKLMMQSRRYLYDGDEMIDLEGGDPAADACANCLRCKRRTFLSHRYPDFPLKESAYHHLGYGRDSDDEDYDDDFQDDDDVDAVRRQFYGVGVDD